MRSTFMGFSLSGWGTLRVAPPGTLNLGTTAPTHVIDGGGGGGPALHDSIAWLLRTRHLRIPTR